MNVTDYTIIAALAGNGGGGGGGDAQSLGGGSYLITGNCEFNITN